MVGSGVGEEGGAGEGALGEPLAAGGAWRG